MAWSRIIATIGVISNIPILGIILRSGARIGSVIRYRIAIKLLLGFTGNQETMALRMMTMVSTKQR